MPFSLKPDEFFTNEPIPDNVGKYILDIKIEFKKPNKNWPKLDWGKCVIPVRDSGSMCQATWAFSITDSLAGISCIKNGSLTSLSAQQLVDCSYKYGNQGKANS